MSTFESVAPTSRLVERLRSAGCVFAEDEAHLLLEAAPDPAALEAMVQRRVDGEPLEHIVGWTRFRGLRIEVDTGVFVPRRRTEFLAEHAAVLAERTSPADAGEPVVVVDLCCGSGAVGVAVATELRRTGRSVELHAADIDPTATACARRNVAAVGGQVYTGDLFAPLPSALAGRITVLTANAPYVPTEAIALMPPEARLHEPRTALDGGADGLGVVARVIGGAAAWLAHGGQLLIETSRGQVPRVAELMVLAGLQPRVATSDPLDATVVTGTPA